MPNYKIKAIFDGREDKIELLKSFTMTIDF